MLLRTLHPPQRAGRREHLARLQQRLDSRQHHGPAAVQLSIGILAQLIVRNLQQTGVTPRFDSGIMQLAYREATGRTLS